MYVGTLANGNPWETLHKSRFGHSGSAMPSTIDLGWSVQDAVDVLAYAQTLLTGEEAPAELPVNRRGAVPAGDSRDGQRIGGPGRWPGAALEATLALCRFRSL